MDGTEGQIDEQIADIEARLFARGITDPTVRDDVLALVAALRDARAHAVRTENMAREMNAAAITELNRAEKAEAEVARLTGIVQAVETRHAKLRHALSFVRAWPDEVTGNRYVNADDLLAILEADKPRAALTGGTDEKH